MIRKKSSLPICDLSFRFEWTPLNHIFFSQCIQDSEEEECLSFQKKKKLKRKSFSSKNTKRKYFVYESVSSESDVPASNEFDSAEEFKKVVKRKKRERKRKRIVPQTRSSEEQPSDKHQLVHCSEKEVKRKGNERKRKIIIHQTKSSEEQPSDKNQLVHCSEVRLEEEKVYDDCELCSNPEIHDSEVDSSHKEGEVKRYSKEYEQDLSSESKEQMTDQLNSVHNSENNDLPQTAEKSKKHTSDDSDYELPSSSKSTHTDDVSSDSGSNENDDLPQTAEISKKHSSDDSDYEIHSSSEYANTDDGSSDSWSPKASRLKRKNKNYEKRTDKSVKQKIPELSEYEKMVQKNREEKMLFLEALKITEIKEDFKEAVKYLEKKNNKRTNLTKEGRKRNGQADVKTEKILRQSERYKSLLKKQEETFASSQLPVVNKESPNILLFEEVAIKYNVYHDFISDCSEPNFRVPRLLSGYASHFEKMELERSLSINMGSGCITSMAIHESQEKIVICFGSKNGEINFCYLNSDSDICTFRPHRQTVKTLKFHPYFPNMLISSSADGYIYSGDFEKNLFSPVFKASSCYHFDFLSSSSYLVAHGNGYVSIVDHRSHRQTFEKRHKCCEDIVKTVDLHPVEKNYFISSHQKGAVKLWDLRKLQDQPIIDVNCNGDMKSSFFSPVTGNSVLVTLSDAICLLDRTSLNEKIKLKKSLGYGHNPPAPCCATWLPNTDNALVVGGRSKIDILDDKLNNIFNFTDKCFSSFANINVFHSSLPFLASASRSQISVFLEIE